MKITKFLLVTLIMFAMLTLNATRVSETIKSNAAEKYDATMQCGVSNSQITAYLQNCSHHHAVLWVTNIEGTCNSKAGIENCGTATVYVTEGVIVGHTDSQGYCGN
jgi:hypothetical protein